MNIRKIIATVLFLIPTLVFSQKKYAPLNATWNYEGHEIDCNGNHLKFTVEKEINIQDKDCSIIYSYKSSDINPTFVKTTDSLIVWENQNQVFFLENSNFYLLYDFNAEIGDTITYFDPTNNGVFSSTMNHDPTNGPNELKTLITGIELKNIQSEQTKFFTTENVYINDTICSVQNIIIENIGSTSQGITGEYCVFVASGCFGGLQCYKNEMIEYNTSAQFQTPNPNCDIMDYINEQEKELNFLIYPNPTSSHLNLVSDSAIKSIEIINSLGEINSVIAENNVIELRDLNPGMYFLRIKTKTSIQIVEFFKK